jgi:hypothetical protein
MEELHYKLNYKFDKNSLIDHLTDDEWAIVYPEDGYVNHKVKIVDNNDVISSIKHEFKFLGDLNVFFMKILPGAKLRWHVDQYIECNIILPLSDNMFVEHLYNDVIYETYYNTPIVLNTRIKHRVINHTNNERYAFYLNIKDFSYNEVVSKCKEKYT